MKLTSRLKGHSKGRGFTQAEPEDEACVSRTTIAGLESSAISTTTNGHMMTNNIPISKGLRDDLSIGYGKAIRYADEKIRKWENERAGNAPQTAQGGAQSTETPIDDRMLAQRGERAQNGSKAVRGKSAQKQGNKKAADERGGRRKY